MSDTRPNESDPSLNWYATEIFKYPGAIYICKALPWTPLDFPWWQIKKVTVSFDHYSITFPDKNSWFIHRVSKHLDYSYE